MTKSSPNVIRVSRYERRRIRVQITAYDSEGKYIQSREGARGHNTRQGVERVNVPFAPLVLLLWFGLAVFMRFVLGAPDFVSTAGSALIMILALVVILAMVTTKHV